MFMPCYFMPRALSFIAWMFVDINALILQIFIMKMYVFAYDVFMELVRLALGVKIADKWAISVYEHSTLKTHEFTFH